jgi:hypothetical protein
VLEGEIGMSSSVIPRLKGWCGQTSSEKEALCRFLVANSP